MMLMSYYYYLYELGSVSRFFVRIDKIVGRKRNKNHGGEGGGINHNKMDKRTGSQQKLPLVSLFGMPVIQDRRRKRSVDEKKNEKNDNSSN